MTEAEWFATNDLRGMAAHLSRIWSDRKGRLLSCSCLRLVWDELFDVRCRRAVEVAERFADGSASEYERMVAAGEARDAEKAPSLPSSPLTNHFFAVAAKMCLLRKPNAGGVCHFVSAFARGRKGIKMEIATLTREVVGNPFRPIRFHPAWRTETAVLLARRMYESRDFGAMPILADALQDAGCDADDLLAHCRDPHAVHVRGCWAVDLVLGKA